MEKKCSLSILFTSAFLLWVSGPARRSKAKVSAPEGTMVLTVVGFAGEVLERKAKVEGNGYTFMSSLCSCLQVFFIIVCIV